MINVLFVCLGNICRSPMAHAVFAHKVRQAGLEGYVQVDSAGTSGWDVGSAAHPGTLEVLAAHRVSYAGRARQFDQHDLATADFILAMDRSNLNDIMRVVNRIPALKAARLSGGAQGPEISLFLSYANRLGTVVETEVSDPYYDDRFDYVYQLVNLGSDALLAHIRQVASI